MMNALGKIYAKGSNVLSLVAEELFISAPSVVLLVTFDVMVVSDV
jgi:hypothetical protein